MSNNVVVFRNEGLIDVRAIRTFGISSKESKSPIGYFGTGLKYAIAVLLRTGHHITIFRGEELYKFSLIDVHVRVNDFKIVCMNGAELAFTTELGKNWSVENAFRELYCNCLDENGTTTLEAADTVLPVEDQTLITVVGSEFEKAYHSRHSLVFTGEPTYDFGNVQIISGESVSAFLYYRGVRAHRLEKPSLYTYNITSKQELTEDRTLSEVFGARYEIAGAILGCSNYEVILNVLQDIDHMERDLNFDLSWYDVSEEFLECCDRIVAIDPLKLNDSAHKLWRKKRGKRERFIHLEMTPTRQQQLDNGIAFCRALDIPVDMFQISCVETLGPDILGLAKDGKIYLTRRTFEEGMHTIVAALIEEYVHLRYGCNDFTRDFQNAVIKILISVGENKVTGEPL